MHARASSGPDIAVQYLVLVTMVCNALVAIGSAPLFAVVPAVIVPAAAIGFGLAELNPYFVSIKRALS